VAQAVLAGEFFCRERTGGTPMPLLPGYISASPGVKTTSTPDFVQPFQYRVSSRADIWAKSSFGPNCVGVHVNAHDHLAFLPTACRAHFTRLKVTGVQITTASGTKPVRPPGLPPLSGEPPHRGDGGNDLHGRKSYRRNGGPINAIVGRTQYCLTLPGG